MGTIVMTEVEQTDYNSTSSLIGKIMINQIKYARTT